jgi:hypothetical protein
MGVIAQAIEKLRAIGLRVDRLQFDPLGEFLALGTFGLGIEVDAFLAFPDSRQPAQRPQIGQAVGIGIVLFGEDIVGKIGHGVIHKSDNEKLSAADDGRGKIRFHGKPLCD